MLLLHFQHFSFRVIFFVLDGRVVADEFIQIHRFVVRFVARAGEFGGEEGRSVGRGERGEGFGSAAK
jgi:hypothetical protein